MPQIAIVGPAGVGGGGGFDEAKHFGVSTIDSNRTIAVDCKLFRERSSLPIAVNCKLKFGLTDWLR